MMENADKYGTKAIQKELLEMMKEIHTFCVENDIKYSLSGGSCLGAIRHNGFIPWDDDMDIMVDRKNYNLLLDKIQAWDRYTVEPELWIQRIRRNSQSENGYVPTVDIFVMDHTPEKAGLQRFKIVSLKILQGMMKEKPRYEKFSWGYKLALASTYYFGKLFTKRFKFRLYNWISQIGNKKETKYVTAYNDLFKLLSVKYDGDTMEHLVEHPFEDANFYVPAKYDAYLTAQYGDYMTPPEERERKPGHI